MFGYIFKEIESIRISYNETGILFSVFFSYLFNETLSLYRHKLVLIFLRGN